MNQHRYTCPRCSWPVKAPVVGQTEPIVCLNCRAQIEPMTGAILNGDASAASPVPDATATSLPPPKKAYPRKPVSAAGLTSAPQTPGQAAPAAPVAARRVPMQAGPQPAQHQHAGVPYPAQVPPQFPGQYPPQGAPYPAQQPPLRYPPQQGVPYPEHQPPQFLAPGQARPGLPGVPFGPAARVRRGMPRWGWALVAAGALVMIGLVALGFWAVGGGGAANTDNWITYTSPDKIFTAKFPEQPSVQTHRLDNGIVVNETMFRSPWGHWEVSWFHWDEVMAPYPVMVAELANSANTTVTRGEDRAWKDNFGYYAELGDGLYKVQMFVAGGRLWTVAVFRQEATFEFFLDNLKITDQALGVDPLRIEFSQQGLAFEGGNNTSWGWTIHGGRMPYKVSFSKPFPDTRYAKEDVGYLKYEYHTGFSSAAKAGMHNVEADITDADGRITSGKWSIEVLKMPDTLGSMQVKLSAGSFDTPIEATDSITVPLGYLVRGKSVFVPSSSRFEIVHPYYNVDDPPEWLKFGDRGEGWFSGRAEEVGTYTFKVHTRVRLHAMEKWYPVECTVTVEVVPLSQDEIPRDFGSFKVLEVNCVVGSIASGSVEFFAPVPLQWRNLRPWEISASWALTAEEMKELVPKGVFVTISTYRKSDVLAGLLFSGKPEVVVDKEVEFKLIVTVKYLPEPLEMIAKVRFKVDPLPVPASLNAPAEGLIRARATRKLDTMFGYDIGQPVGWPRGNAFEYEVTWQIEDVVLPKGITLEVIDHATTGRKRLMVRGSMASPGEYTFEVPLQVTLKYADKTYDLTQKIKIVIS